MLRNMFGLKRDKITKKGGGMYSEKLHDLSSSLHIIRMLKSRKIKCAGRVASMEARRIKFVGGET